MTETLQTPAIEWNTITSGTHEIPLELICASPDNARKTFSDASIAEMCESLIVMGQIEAAQVRAMDGLMESGRFELIGGERRFRAIQKLGWPAIRCEVKTVESVSQAHRMGLLANIAREDVAPLELGYGYKREMELGGHDSVKSMAIALGMPNRVEIIRDHIGLTNLVPDVADALREGEITYSHAVLISGEKPSDQARCLAACFVTETVTIGLLPETSARLITEKALRSWIQTHLREPATDEALANKLAKQRIDAQIQTQSELSLANEGARLAGEDEDDEDEDASGDELPGDGERERLEFERHHQTDGPVQTQPQAETTAVDVPATKANVKAARDDREIVENLCDFLSADFKDLWRPGERVDAFVIRIINYLCDKVAGYETAARKLRPAADVSAATAVSTPKKAKMPTETQIGNIVSMCAKYIAEAMEIDDSDVTSMRETGLSDESMLNLLEAHFEDEVRDRPMKFKSIEFDLFFCGKFMRIKFEDAEIAYFDGAKYADLIGLAMDIPAPGGTKMGKKKAKKK